MPEPFRGAPTRIGRILLAVFGAPFMLAALSLGVFGVFGHDPPGERLTMLIGATVFAGAGLFLWAPAFPDVVNRFLRSDSRLLRRFRAHLPQAAMGGMIILMGTVPVLAAIGIVPTDDGFWQAPRWVGGIAGGLFVIAGLYVLSKPTVDRLEPRLRKQILGLFPLLIVTGMAVIGGWIAFGPGVREFSAGAANPVLGFSWGSGELAGRIAFGLGASALAVITLIGWWKYLTGRW